MRTEVLTRLAAGLFMPPFLAVTARQPADKFNRAPLTRWVKVLEIVIIAVAPPESDCTAYR
jgi:hypothetical protein